MILEHALLQVRPGDEGAFEAAMAVARPLIAASPGFGGMEVRPAIGQLGLYLLCVQWGSVADHRDGFRQSDRYQQWRALLHHFYEPMPVVSYFGEPLVYELQAQRTFGEPSLVLCYTSKPNPVAPEWIVDPAHGSLMIILAYFSRFSSRLKSASSFATNPWNSSQE
jgi:heme-degrading monooxygenase HmoA